MNTAPVPRLHRPSVGSTNAEAFLSIRDGQSVPFWLVADEQTDGRGRGGRGWDSPVGNLYASLAVPVARPLREAPTLAFVSALAVSDAVSAALGPQTGDRVLLKWPNDVLVGGAKVSGVLLECGEDQNGAAVAVIGCGINVASAPEGLDRPVTALCQEGSDWTPDQVLDALDRAFLHWLDLWNRNGFSAIREPWLSRASGLGGEIEVRLSDGSYRASFDGLDRDGALMARMPNGDVRRVAAGDVFPITS